MRTMLQMFILTTIGIWIFGGVLAAAGQAPEELSRPFAYVIPGAPLTLQELQAPIFTAEHTEVGEFIAQTLQSRGVRVEELREDIELTVTIHAFQPTGAREHRMAGTPLPVRTETREETVRIHAGAYIIRGSQPRGSVAVNLLEPHSEESLLAAGELPTVFRTGSDYPVFRIETTVPLLTVEARPHPDERQEREPLTFEGVYEPAEGERAPNLGGRPASIVEWIDSERFLQVKSGRLHIVHAATGRSEPFHDISAMAGALASLPTIDRRAADSIARRTSFQMDDAREGALIEYRGDLYYARFDGTQAVRLTSHPAREEVASFSPDGRFVAFVRENDLWVVDIETQRERQLTTGGTDLVRNGKADWVYYEELYRRDWRVFWWSPDSSRIAYLRIDSRPVRSFTILTDVRGAPSDQHIETSPYPKAGTPNPRASLHIVDVAGGEPREVDLWAYNEEDMLIVGVGWWPDSSAAYAWVTNRTQTWMDMLACAPGGGRSTKLFRETTGAWVAHAPAPLFLRDRSFIFSSERDGWLHLYHYDRNGALIRQITQGEWEVRPLRRGGDVAVVDPDQDWLYFHATRDNLIAPQFYRASLDGSTMQRLTVSDGVHSCSVSPDGRYFTASWSRHTHPTRVALFEITDAPEAYAEVAGTDAESAETNIDGSGRLHNEHSAQHGGAHSSLVRILDTNPVRDLERFDRLDVELVQIETPDGFVLEGSLLFPPGFNPELQYPVWFTTYAGPRAATISDSWGVSRVWDQVMAHRGYVVFRADPRSASNKGAISAWVAYKQLGAPELEDIGHLIEWLRAHPWVDPARIGMSGHSYGGFITAYAMTHTDLFAAGIAGAPVTDWRLYDTIYTERFMLTPQENAEGYDRTSVLNAAANLHGRLLLLHGLVDDNVHLQNTTRLMHAFQGAGVQNFEVMFYPEARHGLSRGPGARHYQRLMIEFIDRTIGPGGGRVGTQAPADWRP